MLLALSRVKQAGQNASDVNEALAELRGSHYLDGLSGRFFIDETGERQATYNVLSIRGSVHGFLQQLPFTCSSGVFTQLSTPTYASENSAMPDVKVPNAPNAAAVSDVTRTSATFSWEIPNLKGADLIKSEIRICSAVVGCLPIEETTSLYLQKQDIDTAFGTGLELGSLSVEVRVVNRGGPSPFSTASSFVLDAFVPCSQIGCLGEYAQCNSDSGECECIYSYLREVQPIRLSRSCELPNWDTCTYGTPCVTSTPYQACDANSGQCKCTGCSYNDQGLNTGVEQGTCELQEVLGAKGANDRESKECILSLASTDDTRKFWAISLWLSAWGVLFSVWVMWEFIVNAQLKYPNTMTQAFIAFAVPDFALSFLNFVVYMVQLVDGN